MVCLPYIKRQVLNNRYAQMFKQPLSHCNNDRGDSIKRKASLPQNNNNINTCSVDDAHILQNGSRRGISSK